jgi:hypothetical protein
MFLKCKNIGNFTVVKPINFIEKECLANCNKDVYSCAVIMERLISPVGDYAVHLTMNGVVPAGSLNRLSYTGKGIPRGYYYDPDNIQAILSQYNDKISSLEDITYRIGLLEGIAIFGARVKTTDVEYILSVKDNALNITVLDFGMAEQLNITEQNSQTLAEAISRDQEYNLYYHPYSEAIPPEHQESCKEAFISGITQAFDCFYEPTYQLLFDSLIKIYENPAY